MTKQKWHWLPANLFIGRMPMPRVTRFTEDRANPDVCILQIRRGGPVQRKELVTGKKIIGSPVLREISIFHRTNADLLRNFAFFCVAQVWILLVDDFPGSLARFLEKLAQRNVLARARFH